MVVAARLRWIRQRILDGVHVRVHIGAAADPEKCKVKVHLDSSRPRLCTSTQSTLLSVLDAIASACAIHVVVDRGHKHSGSDHSEAAFWLAPLPPAPDDVDGDDGDDAGKPDNDRSHRRNTQAKRPHPSVEDPWHSEGIDPWGGSASSPLPKSSKSVHFKEAAIVASIPSVNTDTLPVLPPWPFHEQGDKANGSTNACLALPADVTLARIEKLEHDIADVTWTAKHALSLAELAVQGVDDFVTPQIEKIAAMDAIMFQDISADIDLNSSSPPPTDSDEIEFGSVSMLCQRVSARAAARAESRHARVVTHRMMERAAQRVCLRDEQFWQLFFCEFAKLADGIT